MIEDGVNMKKKIEDILEETGFRESRAAKMDVNDLLKFVVRSLSPCISILMLAFPGCCLPSMMGASTSHDIVGITVAAQCLACIPC